MELKALADQIFSDVLKVSRDGRGVSRPAYGDAETRTIEVLQDYADRFHIHSYRDPAANVVFETKGPAGAQRHILIGSHLDSVPNGGNYDGLAGVVAGILLLHQFQSSAPHPKLPVKVIGFRGEESAWFGIPYLGSKALLGRLTAADLEALHRDGRKPLKESLESVGADVQRIARGTPLIDTDRVAAFIELHIEQGPIMVDRNLPVAAVTGIRGSSRHRRIHCRGAAAHSGATPRWLRRDAVFATAELITRLDDHWTTILQHGGDLVLTVGMLSTDPQKHAMTRIPGDVRFSFEARSQNQSTLTALEALLLSECETIENNRRVAFEFDTVIRTPPAVLDKSILRCICGAIEAEGYTSETLPSGAGHDAAVFATAGVPTGMIFIRNQNGSHNPEESIDMDDFIAGVRVLHRSVLEYSK